MTRALIFCLFFVSGFCSLIYEVVWLRLAMARFGVGTPLVSIVLSVFMGGLALGSWGAGRMRGGRGAAGALGIYAAAEVLIGISGIAVPALLDLGRQLLNSPDGGRMWGSGGHYLAAGAWIALTLLPACACMGATIPLAMAAFDGPGGGAPRRSFSFLYLANVLGASAGTLLAAFVMIESFGFRGTSRIAAGLNVLVAVAALVLGRARESAGTGSALPAAAAEESRRPARRGRHRGILLFLFATGLASMGMEVVWVRQFTPLLGPVVYTFAMLLAIYLAATFAGTAIYRALAGRSPGVVGEPSPGRIPESGVRPALLCVALSISGLLPLIGADPRLASGGTLLPTLLVIGLSVAPFCGLLGYATPLLVDRFSGGDPRLAGAAYAANVLGCLAGPLFAGFVLLPMMDERFALLILGLPLFAGALVLLVRNWRRRGVDLAGVLTLAAAAVLPPLILSQTRGQLDTLGPHAVYRDATATSAAVGEGRGKRLLVNGVGMTHATPIAKMMAHLPLVLHERPTARTLVICLGMGTTFRSALSWGAATTVVELVPSVPRLFGYFHPDGPDLLRRPAAAVVIDDGRRFLERTSAEFDVITVDPPPPLEAAASSLLYSREFYALALRRLRPDGILQQWIPGGEPVIEAAVAAAVRDSFPHVRVLQSIEGWGYHLLASRTPIALDAPARLAARLPEAARADMLEWGPAADAERQLALALAGEVPLDSLTAASPGTGPITDDRPVNEYYFLRRLTSGYRNPNTPW